MSLFGSFKHTHFLFCRSSIDMWYWNRFGYLNWTLTHSLSFECSLQLHFTWLDDLNLLDGGIKGIEVLLSNRKVVQFELHFNDSTCKDVAKIVDSNRIALYKLPQRDCSMCRFNVLETGLIFLQDRPMFGDLITCAI